MELLYLSHCVPNPPDKGEKIRAYHEVRHLAARHKVHVVCFARSSREVEEARALNASCASVYVEPLSSGSALGRAALRFAAGACLSTSFYASRRMDAHIRDLSQQRRIECTIAYSSAMAPHAPHNVPLILDMVDVDSEKWFQYGQVRHPGPIYRMEGRRLRALEVEFAGQASCSLLSTRQELALFRRFASGPRSLTMENGVDLEYFNPEAVAPLPELAQRRALAFTGAMDYFPNADGACWFAREVYPMLRRRESALEFWIVGRNPTKAVQKLAALPGVSVTGSVPDVRPYLAASVGVVTPLRIARGIQNKVLEALAMGKAVLASSAVCATFGDALPAGITRCESAADYAASQTGLSMPGVWHAPIREDARRRFSWDANLQLLDQELLRLP
jgi:sugar transferase (PEP-CTERM/EpsH1 system associated)